MIRISSEWEANVNLKRLLGAGVILTVVLTASLRQARADQKKTSQSSTTTQSAPQAKPVQQAKPAVVQPKVNAPPRSPASPGSNSTGQGTNTNPVRGIPERHPPVHSHSPDAYHYTPRQSEKQTPLANGRSVYHDTVTNRSVEVDKTGQVHKIEAPLGMAGGRMTINRGPHSAREIVTVRPGGIRVVGYGAHRGFVERPLRPGYISRTYLVGGRSYAHVYREYRYGRFTYYRYMPAVYYGPAFYGWVARPWAVPIAYRWGGFATPWFGFYAGYFAPYPAYPSADLWLTDYMIGENLRLAYESQQAGDPGQTAPPVNAQLGPVLTPEMKALIAEEVRQQLAAERAASVQPTSSNPSQPISSGEQLPPALNQKFFVVSSNLDLTVAGQACSLTPGDVLQRKGKQLDADGNIAVEVVSSKPGECSAEAQTTVELAALQEMHNQFREQIDSGLKMLAENQAKGMPASPAAAARAVEEGVAPAADDAATQLEGQQTAAAALEAQVRQGGAN